MNRSKTLQQGSAQRPASTMSALRQSSVAELGYLPQTGAGQPRAAGGCLALSLYGLWSHLSSLSEWGKGADQTARLVHLAALMWALGLSLRQVVLILAAFGVKLSRMSVWRDGQQIGAVMKQRRQVADRVTATVPSRIGYRCTPSPPVVLTQARLS